MLARAAATLGADPKAQFRHIYLPLLAPGLAMCFCLAFVQAFSVFPSAVLLGAPAGPTRVISIAAYEAAFEQYDYSLASAIAMIMGFVQLVIVAFVLSLRNWFYKGRSPAARAEACREDRMMTRRRPPCGHDVSGAIRGRGASARGRLLWGVMTLFVVNIGADDRGGRDELVRAALARHVAAARLDDARGTSTRGRNSSSAPCCGSPSKSCSPSCSSRC